MNKQVCDKIKFMLWGINSRIEENKDFIKSVSFTFKSGLKSYEGYYDLEKSIVNFNGRNMSLTPAELGNFVSGEAANYEALEFRLEERGRTTILNADAKGVKTRQADSNISEKEEHASTTSTMLKRDYYVKVTEASELLREIGILTREGKVKNDMIRKYNQIDHFVELVDAMLDELGDTDTINVLDCACGKSYLTFVLNYYIKEKKKKNCYFIGIDRSHGVIESSRKMASSLGYKNMDFIEGDLNTYTPDRRVDLVISLHACDIATDMALGLAVRVNSRAIMCVPCCHRELLEQYNFKELAPLLRHGVFKSRFADMLTDSTRALLLETQGYKVSVVEYISPLETPKNLLIRAMKVSDKNLKAIEEYKSLKAMLGINPYLERYLNI